MSKPSEFSKQDYTHHENLTDELQFLREVAYSKEASPNLKKAMIWVPISILSLTFFGLHVVVAIGLGILTFIIIVINIHQREGDAITATCPACQKKMQRIWEANIEYFVCHHCKIYARGRECGD